jgi:hypothetical protein
MWRQTALAPHLRDSARLNVEGELKTGDLEGLRKKTGIQMLEFRRRQRLLHGGLRFA